MAELCNKFSPFQAVSSTQDKSFWNKRSTTEEFFAHTSQGDGKGVVTGFGRSASDNVRVDIGLGASWKSPTNHIILVLKKL